MSDTILAQIAALKTKSTPELRDAWRQMFDREAPPFGRRYLEDRIAFRLQELRLGSLSDRARRKLDALADQLNPKAARRREPGQLLAGSRLEREWQAVTYHVIVLADGFEWQGGRYKSLSAVARAITGTRWNGPLFFGLRAAGKAK